MSASIVTNAESAVAPSGLTRARFWPRLAGFVELTKPRIAVLELVVVFVAAMISTAGPPQGWTIICALAGTALVAASASTWNQWRERATDALMTRTAERPLPASTIHPWEAAAWGTILGIAGVAILAMFVNATVALLGIGCWALYVLAYTPLKTRSPFNTVVGAVAGAIPALMGA
ncbi:MAG: protoheme IX farnesyltransferase, partial [Pirellulales bacterium]|nr:protoheme IX farnesyltransferase [Pirellulales bacterium]